MDSKRTHSIWRKTRSPTDVTRIKIPQPDYEGADCDNVNGSAHLPVVSKMAVTNYSASKTYNTSRPSTAPCFVKLGNSKGIFESLEKPIGHSSVIESDNRIDRYLSEAVESHEDCINKKSKKLKLLNHVEENRNAKSTHNNSNCKVTTQYTKRLKENNCDVSTEPTAQRNLDHICLTHKRLIAETQTTDTGMIFTSDVDSQVSPSIDDTILLNLRGKMNTPASNSHNFESRFTSTKTTRHESAGAAFTEAEGLLPKRGLDVKQFINADQTSRRYMCDPDVMLVSQRKPVPMPPLKAWKGYHGNVYFQPINVFGLGSVASSPVTTHTSSSRFRDRTMPDIHATSSQNTKKPDGDSSSILRSRSEVSFSALRPKQFNSKNSLHLYRNKTAVISTIRKKQCGINRNRTIASTKSAKSLTDMKRDIGDISVEMPQQNFEHKVKVNKEKICKGSVAHALTEGRDKRSPQFNVIGDRLTSAPPMSPILLSQTQYSRSAQRMVVTSPDTFRADRLPPLEQLRATLRQINNSSNAFCARRQYPLKPSPMYQATVKFSRDTKDNIGSHKRLATAAMN